MADEWYYVYDMRTDSGHGIYRCDQFDGLLKCLEYEVL